MHSLAGHSLAITDVYCGAGRHDARVVTASLDRTCKLWELASGTLLASFTLPAFVSSVCMDAAEYRLYAGLGDGRLYAIRLRHARCAPLAPIGAAQPPLTRPSGLVAAPAMHRSCGAAGLAPAADDAEALFAGHDAAVGCVAVSSDGATVVSGADDGTCIVWDARSRQQLKRFAHHRGAITNLLVVRQQRSMHGFGERPSAPPFAPLCRFGGDSVPGADACVPAVLGAPTAPDAAVDGTDEGDGDEMGLDAAALQVAEAVAETNRRLDALSCETAALRGRDARWARVAAALGDVLAAGVADAVGPPAPP